MTEIKLIIKFLKKKLLKPKYFNNFILIINF